VKKPSGKFEKAVDQAVSQSAPDPELVLALKKEIASLKEDAKKKQTLRELLYVAFAHSLEHLPPITIPPVQSSQVRGRREEVAILHVSDTQFGKVTSNYDSDVASARIVHLAEKVCEVIDVRRSAAKIDEVRLYLGGDIVEGELIFPTQPHLIDQAVFDQACRTAPLALARLINILLRKVKVVRVKTVDGNHGDGSKHAHPRSNWDRVCYEVLRVMLLGYEGNPRLELQGRLFFDISDEFFAVDRVWDWGNLIVHGDQIRGGFAGFPWYGTAKKAWGWIDSIPQPWDYLWFGHFHTPASAVLNHRIFLANGTTESSNSYAQENMAAAGWPCQRLAFFNEKHGLVADGMIYLTDDRKPSSRRSGVSPT
jgi:hypothetical protein